MAFSDSFGPGTPFWELGDEMKTRLAGMVEGGYERGELTEQLTLLIEDDSIFELPNEQMGEGVTETMPLLPDGPDTSFLDQTDAGDQFAGQVDALIHAMMKGEPPTTYNIAFWETFTRKVTTTLTLIVAELKRQQLRAAN